ncbi:hypothetical protein L4D04_20285 [Photobacterium angustum]|uniref:Uncharacterized protein n=1 Tax=Photobacterium angustum (strain S14 / CCUG 15956) TaxID=314292 RepID=Q1ZMU2_PHOAS|nr:hypothetical protein [Photobacterium angustum]EAS63596.1 hypothetical protein VAS14_08990 [Vibrio angustum S14] [Photobacterium angustum S14]
MRKLLIAALFVSPITHAEPLLSSRPIVTMHSIVNAAQCADTVAEYPENEVIGLFNFAVDVLDETAKRIGYNKVEKFYAAAEQNSQFVIDKAHCDALIDNVVMPYLFSAPITLYQQESES